METTEKTYPTLPSTPIEAARYVLASGYICLDALDLAARCNAGDKHEELILGHVLEYFRTDATGQKSAFAYGVQYHYWLRHATALYCNVAVMLLDRDNEPGETRHLLGWFDNACDTLQIPAEVEASIVASPNSEETKMDMRRGAAIQNLLQRLADWGGFADLMQGPSFMEAFTAARKPA